MTLGGVRQMPVVRGGRLVGVVSERDLLRASLSNLTEFAETAPRVPPGRRDQRVMSAPPIVIHPDATAEEAALVRAKEDRCLPVVEPTS